MCAWVLLILFFSAEIHKSGDDWRRHFWLWGTGAETTSTEHTGTPVAGCSLANIHVSECCPWSWLCIPSVASKNSLMVPGSSFMWKNNSIHAQTGRLTPRGPEISAPPKRRLYSGEFRSIGPGGAAVVGKWKRKRSPDRNIKRGWVVSSLGNPHLAQTKYDSVKAGRSDNDFLHLALQVGPSPAASSSASGHASSPRVQSVWTSGFRSWRPISGTPISGNSGGSI